MNRFYRMFAVGILLGGASLVKAQEPLEPGEMLPPPEGLGMHEPPPPGDVMESRMDGPPPQRLQRGRPDEPRPPRGSEEMPMVERWLNHLRSKDQAEFDRLMQLRGADPKAFREEMGHKLAAARVEKLKVEHPAVHAAIQSLPENERRWVLDRLMQPNPGKPRYMPEGNGPHGQGPNDKAKHQLHELAVQYRSAESDADKSRVETQLREELGRLFDEGIQERKDDISSHEKKIDEIRQTLEARQARRDEIIENRLKFLLENDAWE